MHSVLKNSHSRRSGFFSYLTLKDGSAFAGLLHGEKSAEGEVVFTTGMVGYVETLTDPSYAGQIVVFTYPLIGNYGVPPRANWESGKIHARGVVVSQACEKWSHTSGKKSLTEWTREQGVPLLSGIDTRALTKRLREHGVMLGRIAHERQSIESTPDPGKINLLAEVSINRKRIYGKGRKIIVAVDCGMKENILRELMRLDAAVHRVPYDYDYSEDKWDGIFLSNGPGNPQMAQKTVSILQKAMSMKKPIMGICLGSQLMGLAAGATTYKLPYGHRGQNQPCMDTASGRCYITSQNHGYAVEEKSLPRGWRVNFRNLNDGSVEGIVHKTLPFFSVQFHPEAAPGPTDTRYLFQQFYDLL